LNKMPLKSYPQKKVKTEWGIRKYNIICFIISRYQKCHSIKWYMHTRGGNFPLRAGLVRWRRG
jgi:hypothetical protein